jgi:hypothetical protein
VFSVVKLFLILIPTPRLTPHTLPEKLPEFAPPADLLNLFDFFPLFSLRAPVVMAFVFCPYPDTAPYASHLTRKAMTRIARCAQTAILKQYIEGRSATWRSNPYPKVTIR